MSAFTWRCYCLPLELATFSREAVLYIFPTYKHFWRCDALERIYAYILGGDEVCSTNAVNWKPEFWNLWYFEKLMINWNVNLMYNTAIK